MRALLLSACLLSLPFLPGPLTAQESLHLEAGADITGAYRVAGRNPDGSAYTGTLEMTANGAQYQLAWTIAGQVFRGTGRLEGRILTVDWQGDSNPVVYVLMPNGALHGTWADGHALDRLEPLR
ncbi:LIC10280 family protein [Mameliella alba]|uniref:Fibronectin-binding protein n=1 Tax=Mameliella alba TaxID=561184 RepID=A0A0B3S5Z9_9RHOB|nr:hypothetical protein [Mameliella alba]KHQ52101.1 Fibronectin-binding protein [Mameliella alba]